MRFIAVTDLHNCAIDFISHDIVAVLTHVGFCRITSSRSVGSPPHIRGFHDSVRMRNSLFNISSSPPSFQHLPCNLCLYSKPF